MKYAFLGAGKMAMALIQGALRANLCSPSEVIVSSRSQSGLETFVSATGVCSGASNAEAVSGADTVLLCVKPADALKALQEAGEFAGREAPHFGRDGLKDLHSSQSGHRVSDYSCHAEHGSDGRPQRNSACHGQ